MSCTFLYPKSDNDFNINGHHLKMLFTQNTSCYLKMLLISACLLLCASTISASNGNKVINIALEKQHKYGELTLGNLQKHVEEIRQLEINTNGVVPMYNFKNLYYYGPMFMGTPGQKINMTYITGYADFWVMSRKLCHQSRWKELCSHHSTYNGKKSSTYKRQNKKFSIMDHLVQGFLAQDTITVGNISVPNQMFGEVTNFTSDFMKTKAFDGVFGLAYPAASQLNVDPPFINMIKKKIIAEPVFAFYMNNCTCGGTCSELVLGGVDTKHYKGDLVYADVTEKVYFTFTMDGLNVGSKAIVPSISAVLDTGSSLIYGPKSYVELINKAIGGRSYGPFYIVDCSKLSSLPNITIIVKGVPLLLKPYDYILQLPGVCISGFVGMDSLKFIILGDIFSRPIYTVYDMGKDRVGFAQAK